MGILSAEMILSLFMLAVPIFYESLGRSRSTKTLTANYDFIVVGGGTSGCIVAARLSENPNVRVLLLETGGSGSIYTDLTWISHLLLFTKLSHRLYSTPQARACGGNRVCELNVARVLGGGSTHNEMGFVRGNAIDYNEWERDHGAKGWSYKVRLVVRTGLTIRFST